jgi:NitT/TauT family transport system permease protein
MVNRTANRTVLPVVGFAVVVVAWWLVAKTGIAPPGQLPTPADVTEAIVTGFRSEDLMRDVRLSVLRVLIGVGIGSLAAVPVGFLLAWYPTLRSMFDPIVSFCRALPPIALSPLVIVYFGIGEGARLSLLIWAAFFSAIVVIYEGVASIDDIYVRAGRSMGASEVELFRRIVVPLTVPQVLVAVRVALGVCWATVVAAELIAAQRGLGALIQHAGNFFRLDDIYAGILLIGLCALLMDRLLVVLMNRLVRWQERVVR